jgi:hypothetical protein
LSLTVDVLGTDIAKAVKDKGFDFDLAMRTSDDATNLVSSAISFVPFGAPLSIALLGGEKIITDVIKGVHAVNEEKKAEGVKHLKPDVWFSTVWGAMTPEWMNKDIKQAYKEHKEKKKQEKQGWKDYLKTLSKKEQRKEKARKFFFG